MKFPKLSFLLLAIFIISCSEKTIDMEKLQERNGILYEVNTTKPFNGTAIRTYSNGQIKVETKIRNGELISDTIWSENGQKSAELNYKDGKLVSKVEWDKNGNEIK